MIIMIHFTSFLYVTGWTGNISRCLSVIFFSKHHSLIIFPKIPGALCWSNDRLEHTLRVEAQQVKSSIFGLCGYCWEVKSCTSWPVEVGRRNPLIYRGFLPSTVGQRHFCCPDDRPKRMLVVPLVVVAHRWVKSSRHKTGRKEEVYRS